MSMVQRSIRSLLLLPALLGAAACDGDDPSGSATGDLQVTITTTAGGGSDANGFGISVDGIAQGTFGSTGGTFTAVGVASGQHTVALTDVAPNCTVTGAGPTRVVSIPGGGMATVAFVVTCI